MKFVVCVYPFHFLKHFTSTVWLLNMFESTYLLCCTHCYFSEGAWIERLIRQRFNIVCMISIRYDMVLCCGDGITNLKDSFQKVDVRKIRFRKLICQKDSFQKICNFIHWTKVVVHLNVCLPNDDSIFFFLSDLVSYKTNREIISDYGSLRPLDCFNCYVMTKMNLHFQWRKYLVDIFLEKRWAHT